MVEVLHPINDFGDGVMQGTANSFFAKITKTKSAFEHTFHYIALVIKVL